MQPRSISQANFDDVFTLFLLVGLEYLDIWFNFEDPGRTISTRGSNSSEACMWTELHVSLSTHSVLAARESTLVPEAGKWNYGSAADRERSTLDVTDSKLVSEN